MLIDLRLPREHGATVAFALSCVLALKLCAAQVLLPIIAISLAMLSLNRIHLPKMQIDFGVRQTVGMAAVSALPLTVALLTAGPTTTVVTITLGFVFCTLVSTAVVQIVVHSQSMKPTWSLIGAAMLAFALGLRAPYTLAALTSIFALHALWLLKHPKPSLKQLGILETITLVACTAMLLFC